MDAHRLGLEGHDQPLGIDETAEIKIQKDKFLFQKSAYTVKNLLMNRQMELFRAGRKLENFRVEEKRKEMQQNIRVIVTHLL